MRRFLFALQFLTVLPVRIKSGIKETDSGASLVFFPVVGVLIGLFLSITARVLAFLPDLVGGAAVLIISIIITGGIHLDGFADTCDGFYGHKPREEMLRIMRDSRIGVMGVIGIAAILLLKFALIVSFRRDFLWKALIIMPAFARWAQALSCAVSEYARSEGKAKSFIEYASKKDIVIGGLITFGLFLLMAGLKGSLIFILTLLCALLFIQYVKGRIGGMTGDTIGATSEIAETAVLFFTLILSNHY